MRTGFVWNGTRDDRATINLSQPFAAFNVPVTVPNPGPDGRTGTADDGAAIQAFNLDTAYLSLVPDQLITNLPSMDTDHYTWEITANRRQTGRWGVLASFAETWSYTGVTALSPNDLINTVNGRNRTSRYNAKISATLEAPWGVRLLPLWRYQSGENFGPTFTSRLNYASISIQAQPTNKERRPNISIVDLRAEKTFTHAVPLLGSTRLGLFVDLYNIFNTNAAQLTTPTYGASYLRPTVITGPRIMRIGARFQF